MPHVEAAPGLATKIAISAIAIAASATIAHLAPSPEPAYKLVDELMRDPAAYAGKEVRIHGYVVPGSIVELGPMDHEFVLHFHDAWLRVHHAGARPDSFKDQTELVERGTLEETPRGWMLVGDTMLTKCGGKYDGAVVHQLGYR